MSKMNQSTLTLKLTDYLGGAKEAWGSESGQRIHDLLVADIEVSRRSSFESLWRESSGTDASFARASVIELARRYRGPGGGSA